MKKLGACILVAVFSLLTMVGCGSTTSTLKMGTAVEGAFYYDFGQQFAKMISDDSSDIQVEAKETAGTAANLRLLSKDYIQVALVQSDQAHNAYEAVGNYEGETANQDVRAVASLYPEVCQIIVRADSEIESIADLKGKKVSIGEEESGTEANAKQILLSYGLDDTLVTEEHYSYEDAAAALEEGKVEAIFVTAGVQTHFVEELAQQCQVKLLSLDEEHMDNLIESYPFYSKQTISQDTYTGQEEEVSTVGVYAMLVVRADLEDDLVEEITKSLYESADDLAQYTPSKESFTPKMGASGVSIPMHQGAINYYKDMGITVEQIEE